MKLEGNPLCPIGRGRLCASGQAALEAYFDPDRLVGPARRVGGRGDDRWERLPWRAAIAQVAAALPARGDGDVIAIAAEERGPCADAWARFWRAAGARVFWTPAATAARLRESFRALTGVDAEPLFDLERATHVLSFGAPVAEGWLSPVWAQRSYGRFRRGNPHTRGRLVQIDARRSMTARKADEWIAVPSEHQAALAYGIIFVLLWEGRVSRTALDLYGGNFGEFERTVVGRYMLDDVAATTGVPVVTILRLARELVASERPLVAVSAEAAPSLVDAVFSLNAIIGAFDRPGGVFAAPRAPAPDGSVLRPGGLSRARVVALRDASVLRALETPPEVLEAIEGADLVVSFSPYLDEAAQAADLLLPCHTPLESWHAVVPAAAIPAECLALAPPAVKPRLDTRDVNAILKAVATTAGSDLAAACEWNDTEDIVGRAVARLAAERRGTPYATPYETDWIHQLERGGWWTPAAASEEAFSKAVLDAGGWIDPFFAAGEIQSTVRSRGGLTFAMPAAAARPAAGSGEPLIARGYPLYATAFTPAALDLAGSPNLPSLYELLGQPEGVPWVPWAELHADTARRLGIEPRSRIRIESAHGAVEAIAVLVDGMRPDHVAVAHVPAVPRGGRWARCFQTDVRRLWPRSSRAAAAVPVRVTRV
ncbi:MAG TPA: molybdopterin-dependent oxidoreductase [Vicinamibacterales bacterium]|nr:molybdopterin-dependent oxidoreductase [Vicinamibacterales bacterium]